EPTPFGPPPLPEFPHRALPSWLGHLVRSEARATPDPTDLAAMLGLAVLATACAGRVIVNPWGDWHEPLNLFTIVALPPGHRKSAVFSSIVQPLQQYEAQAAHEGCPPARPGPPSSSRRRAGPPPRRDRPRPRLRCRKRQPPRPRPASRRRPRSHPAPRRPAPDRRRLLPRA